MTGAFDGFPNHPGYGPYAAVVQRVVDGDTLDLLVDVGFNDYVARRFRLLGAGRRGLDAPEKRGPTRWAGAQAAMWLTSVLVDDGRVTITTEKDPDSFGRYFAIVTLSDGRDLGSLLVLAGHAVWREYD